MFAFDEGDFFLKAGKVFGPDVRIARQALEAAGCDGLREDEGEQSLAFPLRYAPLLAGLRRLDGTAIEPQTCYFVYETDDEGAYLVDVALEPLAV